MSCKWNNGNRLKTLKVSVKGDLLIYETESERAEVHISDNDVAKIVCYHNNLCTVIKKEQGHHICVGEGNTKRDVYHYLRPGGPLPFLRVGITRHSKKGTWSSLPHKFELKPEPGFEEAFFYILNGGSQRAIQIGRGLWCDGTAVDAVWSVTDRSLCSIPMGYHAVVAEPGVRVSYIWAYLAKKKEWEKIGVTNV